MSVEIKVPTLGESVTEATVAKWFKKAGDAVKVDEPLVERVTRRAGREARPRAVRWDFSVGKIFCSCLQEGIHT